MNNSRFRLAWPLVPPYDRTCLSRVSTFPSPECFNPGPYAYLAITTIALMLRSEYRNFTLEIVGSTEFEGPNHVTNDSSIVSLIHRGKADFSPPLLGLTERRYSLVHFSPPIYRDKLAVLYKKPPRRLATLTLHTLFPYRLVLLITFPATIFIFRRICRLYVFSSQSELVYVAVHILVNILLVFIATFLTNLFTKPLNDILTFDGEGALFRQKEYRYTGFSPLYQTILQGHGRGDVLLQSTSRASAFQKNPDLLRREKLAWVGPPSTLLGPWKRHCDLAYFEDDTILGTRYVMYSRLVEDKLTHATSALSRVSEAEAARLGLLRQRNHRHCPAIPRCECSNWPQLRLAFHILAGALGVASLCWLMEMAWCWMSFMFLRS